MTLLLPRRGFLRILTGALAAPVVLGRASLELVRAPALTLDASGLLVPRGVHETTSTLGETSDLNYRYWVSFLGNLRAMTARDILAAPPGVVQPWLGSHDGAFRPLIEREQGLRVASGLGPAPTPFALAESLVPLRTESRELRRLIDEFRAQIAGTLPRWKGLA